MEPNSSLREARHLAAVAAQRVWEELYVSKKPAVEEAFKISLGANTQHRAPSLELVRDPALKLWLQYVEAERRSAYRTVLEVSTPNQIQSKIQKVTGGLTRLTSRSLTMKSSKKEETANVMGRHSHAGNLSYCWADVWLSTQYQLAGLKEQLELERRQRQRALQHVEQFNRLNWKRVEETELLRVARPLGPFGRVSSVDQMDAGHDGRTLSNAQKIDTQSALLRFVSIPSGIGTSGEQIHQVQSGHQPGRQGTFQILLEMEAEFAAGRRSSGSCAGATGCPTSPAAIGGEQHR